MICFASIYDAIYRCLTSLNAHFQNTNNSQVLSIHIMKKYEHRN